MLSFFFLQNKGAGTKTPADNRQVYLFNGQKFADGKIVWDESSHTFSDVIVPVIPGYKAKIRRVAGAITSPEHPTAEFTVTYVRKTGSDAMSPNGPQVPKKKQAVGSKDQNPNLPAGSNSSSSSAATGSQAKTASLSQSPAGRLPQTGEKDSVAATVTGLLSMLASGAIGLYSLTKKRKD